MNEFIIDFVFDNKPDLTVTINKARDKHDAVKQAKSYLKGDLKNLLLKTYVHEEYN